MNIYNQMTAWYPHLKGSSNTAILQFVADQWGMITTKIQANTIPQETINFLMELCDYYTETASGKEPENAEAVSKAWRELMRLSDDNEKNV